MAISTFYFSWLLGQEVRFERQSAVGELQDLIVDVSAAAIRPRVVAARIRLGGQQLVVSFACLVVNKDRGALVCSRIEEFDPTNKEVLHLAKNILDKQIVDIDGKKVVRVNDLRLAFLSTGLYVVAVDVGFEGLLRRLSIARPVRGLLGIFGKSVPSRLILWDEVAAISPSNGGIKLSKEQEKLATLHPSDLADILEDLDRNTQAEVFASLDEQSAADVLEQMETEAQINVLQNLPVEKAADVLEKMPADEVADILDDLHEEKVEELLSEIESKASQEIRELMEYPEDSVGSLMATDYVSFNQNMTVDQTLRELRRLKPEADTVYYLYVLDDDDRLIASVSLRDLVVAEPQTRLSEIMDMRVIKVFDDDSIDSIAELISKYNLIALPVVEKDEKMVGMVIIDDVVSTLLKSRRRKPSLRAD